MAIRHGLAVIVRRPWYTFDIPRYFPLRVEVRGEEQLRRWRALEVEVTEQVLEQGCERATTIGSSIATPSAGREDIGISAGGGGDRGRGRGRGRGGSLGNGDGGNDSDGDRSSGIRLGASDIRNLPNVVLVADCGGLVALDL